MELRPDGRHISLGNKVLEGTGGGSRAVVIDCRFLLYLSGVALLEEELAAQDDEEERKKKVPEKNVPHLTPSIKPAIKIIQL